VAPPGTKKELGQQDRGRRQQPEREVVHARERHVGGAHLQRDHPVGEADEGRHDRAEHHHDAVHGGQLVEELGAEELQAGLEQLGADHQRQHAARQQHGEGEPQVQGADVLVVGGEQPAAQAVRVVVCVVMAVRVHMVVLVVVCVIDAGTHFYVSDSKRLFAAGGQDFRRLHDVLFGLVGPVVTGDR
jgi:hypothetical protein